MSSDALTRYMAKLGVQEPRISENIKKRFQEPFPSTAKPKKQIEWCFRQLEVVKDLLLEEIEKPRRLQKTALAQYTSLILKMRDTIYIERRGQKPDRSFIGAAAKMFPMEKTVRGVRVKRPPQNPLKGMLTEEQEQEIEKAKARKEANGQIQPVD